MEANLRRASKNWHPAALTTNSSASSYGFPVLVIHDRNGIALGTFDAALNDLYIRDATDEEVKQLRAAGYHFTLLAKDETYPEDPNYNRIGTDEEVA